MLIVMFVVFIRPVRASFGVPGLWPAESGPVHSASGARHGVALQVPQVRALRRQTGATSILLRPTQENLLQKRLPQVGEI